ncbi:hypothetical protein KL918_005416, partial [Ogataea parapolymorpha]
MQGQEALSKQGGLIGQRTRDPRPRRLPHAITTSPNTPTPDTPSPDTLPATPPTPDTPSPHTPSPDPPTPDHQPADSTSPQHHPPTPLLQSP